MALNCCKLLNIMWDAFRKENGWKLVTMLLWKWERGKGRNLTMFEEWRMGNVGVAFKGRKLMTLWWSHVVILNYLYHHTIVVPTFNKHVTSKIPGVCMHFHEPFSIFLITDSNFLLNIILHPENIKVFIFSYNKYTNISRMNGRQY